MIEIKGERYVHKGEPVVELKNFKMLYKSQLPLQYIKSKRYCYCKAESIWIYLNDQDRNELKQRVKNMINVTSAEDWLKREKTGYWEEDRLFLVLVKGQKIPKAVWEYAIEKVEDCGTNLKEINEKIKKETKGWNGTVVHKI